MSRPTVCLDVGSGWVKAVGVDSGGEPTGCAHHATTPHDLLQGVHAAATSVGLDDPLTTRRGEVELLACSSAGGGLRLAVVGHERLAATEAGYRVSRSAGARVVHVQAGLLEPSGVRALRSARPDVVLLLDAFAAPAAEAEQTLLSNAARLARARVRVPIVLSVRSSVRAEALALLESTGRVVLAADPVLRAAGEIVPEPAREAVAELFTGHLVGGRGSATTARFRGLARRPTPGAVCRGALELARTRGVNGGALLVIDVGSSTTDAYSVLPVARGEPESTWSTAEADLGMRPTSEGILIEGQSEGLVDPVEADLLAPTVRRLSEETGFLPTDAGGRAEDRRLAALAAVLAARRHLRVAGSALTKAGIGLVVLTGGVFRQPDHSELTLVRSTLRSDLRLHGLLERCPISLDDGFALAPAGLLALAGRVRAARTVLDATIVPESG
jgi:uncharacterized protein (TIGR01319 family)